MCSNWRQRITTSSAEPAKANQNGAVIPNVLASRPPTGVPIRSTNDGHAVDAGDAPGEASGTARCRTTVEVVFRRRPGSI